ncbi:GIY-YIG domain-containing protein [Vibrio crassostreae]|nr:GIY-YIG domain-containing protein [Vibrio crassostreae]
MTKRDTITYELKEGNKVVYVGTTNDPERRMQEHQDAGKKFTKMNVTSRKMTEAGALKKEAARLETYRKNHSAKNPKYNKTKNG